MELVNWYKFNIKNEHFTNAFEEMCLNLFIRKLHINPYNLHGDFNHPGLETKPVEIDNILYGFQSKYHDPDGSGNVFSQIKESLKKIVDKVDIVYIYTNYNIKFISTNKNKEKVRNSQVVEIEQIAKNKGMQIEWVTKVALNEIIRDNIDILQLFFGEGNEIDLIINTLKDEKKFLLSEEFMDLPLNNNEMINTCATYINSSKSNKFIITGQPGSGKSEMIKKLFCDFSGSKLELREQVRYMLTSRNYVTKTPA